MPFYRTLVLIHTDGLCGSGLHNPFIIKRLASAVIGKGFSIINGTHRRCRISVLWPEGGTMSKRELKVPRRSLDDNGYELPATRDQTISLVAVEVHCV